LIKKMWVKFNGMDVVCMCEDYNRKCKKKECNPYVVKFVEITKERKEEEAYLELDRSAKKFKQEITKTLSKMKDLKL